MHTHMRTDVWSEIRGTEEQLACCLLLTSDRVAPRLDKIKPAGAANSRTQGPHLLCQGPRVSTIQGRTCLDYFPEGFPS